jgi:hypothetical protein
MTETAERKTVESLMERSSECSVSGQWWEINPEFGKLLSVWGIAQNELEVVSEVVEAFSNPETLDKLIDENYLDWKKRDPRLFEIVRVDGGSIYRSLALYLTAYFKIESQDLPLAG